MGLSLADTVTGPGRPPCWCTLKESCKGLGSVSLKIKTLNTHVQTRGGTGGGLLPSYFGGVYLNDLSRAVIPYLRRQIAKEEACTDDKAV